MSNSFATPWTIAHQASLSLGFPREEYWSGLLFPSPGDLPDPESKPVCPESKFFTIEPSGSPNYQNSSDQIMLEHKEHFPNLSLIYTANLILR